MPKKFRKLVALDKPVYEVLVKAQQRQVDAGYPRPSLAALVNFVLFARLREDFIKSQAGKNTTNEPQKLHVKRPG